MNVTAWPTQPGSRPESDRLQTAAPRDQSRQKWGRTQFNRFPSPIIAAEMGRSLRAATAGAECRGRDQLRPHLFRARGLTGPGKAARAGGQGFDAGKNRGRPYRRQQNFAPRDVGLRMTAHRTVRTAGNGLRLGAFGVFRTTNAQDPRSAQEGRLDRSRRDARTTGRGNHATRRLVAAGGPHPSALTTPNPRTAR